MVGPRAERALQLLSAAAVSALTVYVWGGLDRPALVHDEASYLLQAEIFASGRLVAPSPPLPRFFDQFHVIVEPVLATKYPPLHALALVPGVLLGLPGLVPVLLAGVNTALVYHLARRVGGVGVALVTVLLHALVAGSLEQRATYFAHSTSELAWLLSMTAALSRSRFRWPLAFLGLVACWLTRPVTALGLAPGTLLALWQGGRPSRSQLLAALGVAFLGGAAMLAWNRVVTGDALLPPWALWARQYIPGDGMGFGWNDAAPLIPYDDDRREVSDVWRAARINYRLDTLPEHIRYRLTRIWFDRYHAYRSACQVPLVLALVGLFTREGRPLRPFVLAAVGLFLAYLGFAAVPPGLRYYLESDLAVALVVPWGAAFGARRLARLWGGSGSLLASIWLVALAVWPLSAAPALFRQFHDGARKNSTWADEFRERLAALPGDRLVVFVRYGADHDAADSLIANHGDLEHARVWTVNDRGAENTALIALSPDREPWLYDDVTKTLTRIPR